MRYMFHVFREKKKKQVSPKEVLEKLESLEKQIAELSEEVVGSKKQLMGAFQKIGMIRYNPFRELGGDQSFSVALLNEKNDGFVLTSHFGRDIQRLYAKTIQGGISEHILADEEREAIAIAIKGRINGKRETTEKRK